MKGTAIVVGAGIFGAVIGVALRTAGWDVTWLDDRRPESGSKPSACLMKPSWFSGMGKENAGMALQTLDRLYTLRNVELEVWPLRATASAYWVPRDNILSVPTEQRRVLHVAPRMVVCEGEEEVREPDLIVVAAGFWSKILMPCNLEAKKGVSFRWVGRHLERNVVDPWAPYKQIVGFNEGGRVWGGDGSAIKPENWDTNREMACRVRVAKRLELDWQEATQDVGLRPYWKGDAPCLLEQRQPGLWLATGGGKNGTIAAGWAAAKILEATS